MKRPKEIVCACGERRAVPERGATPKRCHDCQDANAAERKRARMLAYSRQPEIKARRQRNREIRGHW